MIVVDVQMLVYATIQGQHTKLTERVSEADPRWVAPPLWRSEFRNVMAGYIRRGALTLADARTAVEVAESLIGAEYLPASEDILSLVISSRCSAYDLEYVVTAQSLAVPLVTTDQQILDSFPRVAVSTEAFAP